MKRYMAVVIAVVMAAGIMIGTAGAVLADSEGAGYGTEISPVWTNPGSASGNAAPQTESGQIREPLGTGALPHQSVKLDRPDRTGWVNMNVADQEASPDHRGFHNVQSP